MGQEINRPGGFDEEEVALVELIGNLFKVHDDIAPGSAQEAGSYMRCVAIQRLRQPPLLYKKIGQVLGVIRDLTILPGLRISLDGRRETRRLHARRCTNRIPIRGVRGD